MHQREFCWWRITHRAEKKYSRLDDAEVFDFVKKHKDRYFVFKDRRALDNISFNQYDPKLLSKIEKMYNIEGIVRTIKNTKHFTCSLPYKELKLLAHALFERGYMKERTIALAAHWNMLKEVSEPILARPWRFKTPFEPHANPHAHNYGDTAP